MGGSDPTNPIPYATAIWALPIEIKSTLLLYCEINVHSKLHIRITIARVVLYEQTLFLLLPVTVVQKTFLTA